MFSPEPTVSIIVPTHNRATTLPRTLDALCVQTYPSTKVEVLIVADGCTDNTAEVVCNYQAPFTLRLLEQDGKGPAAARNHGAAEAAGQVLIFFDDDIEIVRDFVEAHMQAHQHDDNSVAIGYLPLANQGTRGYFHHGLLTWWEGRFFKMRQPGYRFAFDDLFSGNFSLSTKLFARVGGFNTSLYCHEDYELGFRLLQAGAAFVFAAGAVGYHHDSTDLDRSLRRRLAEGKADVFLGRRYPELRPHLPMFSGTRTRLSRVLRYLAFDKPQTGDVIAAFLRRRLDMLEKVWLHSGWRYLFHHLLDYWYWRGVFLELDTHQAVEHFFKKVKPDYGYTGPEIEIDLAEGIAVAEQRLDEVRPASVRLCFQQSLVSEIPAQAGLERLRGTHLRRILATEHPGEMLVAMAMGNTAANLNSADLARPIVPLLKKRIPVTVRDYLLLPKKVIELEISQRLEPVPLDGYSGLHALVKYQGHPIGWITLINPDEAIITAEVLRESIEQRFGWDLVPLSLGEWVSSSETTCPPITVVVCTRNRTEQLRHCLQALLALDYPNYEVVVVDNAPSNNDTARLVASYPVRYIREDRPGLDWARNRGVAEAKYGIVAFTDDDAQPDTSWLRVIAEALAEPEVMAVTGAVAPAELETAAQNLFEFGYGGMGHGFYRWFIRRRALEPYQLLWASGFGVGANMAFRRELFASVGAFDVALDIGTISGGGGDVEMFHRLVAKGYTLVYEPAALVWHRHRRDEKGLSRLLYNNGRSFGVYLLTCGRNHTVSWLSVGHFALRYWLWGWIFRRLWQPREFPRRLIWREFLGALSSPFAYVATQIQARQVNSRLPIQPTVKLVQSSDT